MINHFCLRLFLECIKRMRNWSSETGSWEYHFGCMQLLNTLVKLLFGLSLCFAVYSLVVCEAEKSYVCYYTFVNQHLCRKRTTCSCLIFKDNSLNSSNFAIFHDFSEVRTFSSGYLDLTEIPFCHINSWKFPLWFACVTDRMSSVVRERFLCLYL